MLTDSLTKRNKLLVFLQLIKVSVTLPVTFLAFIGFGLHGSVSGVNIWLVCAGIFLLAGSASALNQIIERKYDSIMPRTRRRPLPSNNLSVKQAWIIVLVMAAGGIIILSRFNITSVILGFITLMWYAGVYTFLKRKTGLAVIPGSLTGALPPLIGWTAAGGSLNHPFIIYICILVFIWQIPHFWLLLLIYGKEYILAGFPTLFDHFSEIQIRRLTFIWILISAFYALLYFFLQKNMLIGIGAGSGAFLILSFTWYFLFIRKGEKNLRFLFHLVNSAMLICLLSILILSNIS